MDIRSTPTLEIAHPDKPTVKGLAASGSQSQQTSHLAAVARITATVTNAGVYQTYER